ncbi:hypothetical protein BKA82DRAFT_4347722 [Pisolithus tinctorius]|nr:hypothetical protein BKA82DRAFT_4347722 [Pisolithus tinctorius]
MPALMQFLIASSRNHNNTPVPKTKPLPDEGEDSHIDGDSQAARHASIKPHLQLPSQASQAMTDEEKWARGLDWTESKSESHGYDKKEEQYLDSFHTKIITLTSGKQLDSHVALQLLCASAILRQDVVAEDGPEGDHEQSILPTVPPADVSASPDPLSAPVDSKEDKQVIKNAMSSVDLDDIATDDKDNEANQQLHGAIRADGNAKHDLSSESTAKDEDSDWEADERHLLKLEQLSREILAGNYDLDHHAATPPLEFPSSLEDDGDEAVDVFDLTEISHTKTKKKPTCHLAKFTGTSPVGLDNEENPCNAEQSSQSFKHGRLPLEAIRKAQALGMKTTQEAHTIAMQYGKTPTSIMATAGLTTKATRAKSVWNMHQAWYAHTNPKTSEAATCCIMVLTKMKKIWDEIHEYWKESVSGTKDMSSKAMVGHVMTCRDLFTQAAQTWCNVEDIHIFGCVIYGGNDEAAHQAQGIFAGSPICMELASKRQTDITRLLDYLATIVKYKILDPGVSVVLPDFGALS